MTVFPRLGLAALLSATGVLPAGCSFLFVSAPPDHHEKLYDFDCTTGNVFPVIDSVAATVYGIATASMIADRPEQGSSLATVAAVAAAFGASAVLGFGRTRDCREARGKLAVRLDGLRRGGPGNTMDAPPFAADPWLDPPAPAPSMTAPRSSDAWSAPQGRSNPNTAVPPAGGAPQAPSPPPAVVPASPNSDRSTPTPKED